MYNLSLIHISQIFYGQKASNIIDGIDVVVYTAAIHKDNEEYQAAVQKGLPMLTRAELLGQLMTNYDIPDVYKRQSQLLSVQNLHTIHSEFL